MTTLQGRTNDASGQVIIEKEPLGKGGEGSVYSVTSHGLKGLLPADQLVAKIYHSPNEGDRKAKVIAMVKSPPDSDALAWPLAVLLNSSGSFVGYLMVKLPMERYRMWASFTQGAERKRTSENFDVRYAVTAAMNLAIALDAVHEAGHYVGDVNESNIFIGSDASVFLVDTDSAQIDDGKGGIFPCLVGKPEYTAAELSRGALKDQARTEATDTFAFGVAVYQLLQNGAHPTDGVFKGSGEPPSVVERIREGVLPNLHKERNYKPVDRVPTSGLPKRMVPLFEKMLSPEPKARPSVDEVITALEDVHDHLQQCTKVKQHWFDKRDRSCGWCAHVAKGQVDPWTLNLSAKQKKKQKKLNDLKFQSGNTGGGPVARAPRAPIGSSGAARSGARSVGRMVPPPSAMPGGRGAVAPVGRIAGARAGAQAGAASGGGFVGGFKSGMRAGMGGSSVASPASNLTGPVSSPYRRNNRPMSARAQKKQVQANRRSAVQSSVASGTLPPLEDVYVSSRIDIDTMKGKTVLSSPDGREVQRPPLGVLFQQQPKLAYRCYVNELPEMARLHWKVTTAPPRFFYLLLGLIAALILAYSWEGITANLLAMVTLPEGMSWFPWAMVESNAPWIASLTAAVASCVHFISALVENGKIKKQLGVSPAVYPPLSFPVTVFRMLRTAFFYGPLFLFVLFFMGLYGLISLLQAGLASSGNIR